MCLIIGLFLLKIEVVNKLRYFPVKKRIEWSISPFIVCQEEVIHNEFLLLLRPECSFGE